MIVILRNKIGDDVYIEDVAAVVRAGSGFLRLCRDGKPDEYIDEGVSVTVVNDG